MYLTRTSEVWKFGHVREEDYRFADSMFNPGTSHSEGAHMKTRSKQGRVVMGKGAGERGANGGRAGASGFLLAMTLSLATLVAGAKQCEPECVISTDCMQVGGG